MKFQWIGGPRIVQKPHPTEVGLKRSKSTTLAPKNSLRKQGNIGN